MYCPNCEFEIKQEVTECPICGGELTLHPEETPAAQPVARQTEDIPLDLSISNLLLDAKQELDALDSMPGPASFSDEPEPESLNLETLLSQDTDESPFQFPEVSSEPAMADMPPFTPQQQVFSLPDDDPVPENAGRWAPEPAASADAYPFSPETTMPEQKLFLDDSLFIDEAAPPAAPEETAPFIDEITGKKLASALDSMAIPTQQPDAEPDRIFVRESSARKTDSIDFIPEAQQQSDATPDSFTTSTNAAPDFSLEAFAETPPAAGSSSKFRLIALALLGAVIIAGAYFLADYFLQKTETTQQIATPAPAARKKTKPVAKKTESALPEPAVLAKPAPESATVIVPETTMPAAPPAQPSAVQPAQEPQPTRSVPERSRAQTAPEKPQLQKTIGPQQAALPAAAPADITQAIPPSALEKPAPKPGEFSVHVFSFKTQQAAQHEIDRLNKRGFNAYLETVDLGAKGIWHRVKVGHYATRDEAEQARQDIKKKYAGIEPLIYRNK